MRLDPNPLFRRVITPWYDSNAVCCVLGLAMAVLVFFSITGLMVAQNTHEYKRFVWVPGVLLLLSLFMVFSISWRMVQRRHQHKEG
jgi:Na+/melibiose symporter-like transporter